MGADDDLRTGDVVRAGTYGFHGLAVCKTCLDRKEIWKLFTFSFIMGVMQGCNFTVSYVHFSESFQTRSRLWLRGILGPTPSLLLVHFTSLKYL